MKNLPVSYVFACMVSALLLLSLPAYAHEGKHEQNQNMREKIRTLENKIQELERIVQQLKQKLKSRKTPPKPPQKSDRHGGGAARTETTSDQGTNLLENGGFSDKLSGWSKGHGSNVQDRWNVNVIVQGNSPHKDILRYSRRDSNADGGSTWAVQNIDKSVGDASELTVRADVKLRSHSLPYGSKYGEFPGHIVLAYKDRQGNKQKWKYGFLLTDRNRHPNIEFTQVDKNQWHEFQSENLMDITPKPQHLIKIKIGGRGWDFHGFFDNVKLLKK